MSKYYVRAEKNFRLYKRESTQLQEKRVTIWIDDEETGADIPVTFWYPVTWEEAYSIQRTYSDTGVNLEIQQMPENVLHLLVHYSKFTRNCAKGSEHGGQTAQFDEISFSFPGMRDLKGEAFPHTPVCYLREMKGGSWMYYLVPAEIEDAGLISTNGGNFCHTVDERFNFDYPLPVFDRVDKSVSH